MSNENFTEFFVTLTILLGVVLAGIQTYTWFELAGNLIKRFI
jgi:hypothetical protein